MATFYNQPMWGRDNKIMTLLLVLRNIGNFSGSPSLRVSARIYMLPTGIYKVLIYKVFFYIFLFFIKMFKLDNTRNKCTNIFTNRVHRGLYFWNFSTLYLEFALNLQMNGVSICGKRKAKLKQRDRFSIQFKCLLIYVYHNYLYNKYTYNPPLL